MCHKASQYVDRDAPECSDIAASGREKVLRVPDSQPLAGVEQRRLKHQTRAELRYQEFVARQATQQRDVAERAVGYLAAQLAASRSLPTTREVATGRVETPNLVERAEATNAVTTLAAKIVEQRNAAPRD